MNPVDKGTYLWRRKPNEEIEGHILMSNLSSSPVWLHHGEQFTQIDSKIIYDVRNQKSLQEM